MAGEWPTIALKDIAESINTGLDAITRAPIVPYPTAFKCLRIQDVSNNKIFSDWGFTEVRPVDYEKYRLRRGEIIMARTCSTGINYLVREDMKAVFNNGLARIRLHREVAFPEYVYYVFKSQDFINYIDGISGGTSVQLNMKVGDLANFQFLLPPLAGQKAIAAVLGALDDKIELNRRMNATLEAMARALFQSWFVDFDPVRAKLDGRAPTGMDDTTAALFPASFQDSAVDPIPQGWEVGRLDDVLTLQRGFDLPTPDRTHGKYPVMAASGPNGYHDKFMVRGPGVTTGRSGVLGRVFFIHGDFWPLNTSLWVKEFKRVSPAYAFHLLRGLDFEMFNAGSAVPTLNRNHVHNLPVVMPPKPIVEAFNAQVMPLMKQQKANEDQSHTLAALRDTLLPKLLSGEVRVTHMQP